MDAVGARWYVFGAQAALVWGRPRLTTDVDVTVKCGVSTDQLVRALSTRGFSLRLDGTEGFIRTTRVVPLEHRVSGLALDVVQRALFFPLVTYAVLSVSARTPDPTLRVRRRAEWGASPDYSSLGVIHRT